MGPGSPLAPLLERWNQLPRQRQLLLAGIAAVAIFGAYYVFTSSSSPRMVVAYTGLAPEETAQIADELEKGGIAYEIGGGGSTVSVQANKVAEARIALAQSGLPSGGSVGLEIFDSTDFGATEFQNQVNFLRALQGELSRSINTLEPIRASRVNIVLPDDSLFVEDERPATASVVLQLRPGVSLRAEQVQAIVNLVSNSVEGLDRSGITIVQDSGSVLYDGATEEGGVVGGGTLAQLDVARQYETALANDLNNILAQVVGVGRSAVTVRAMLNFDTVTETSDSFAPVDQAVPRSSSTTTETFTGNNLTVGGVPGTGTNGGVDGGDTEATGASEYTRTETTTNNEISRTTTSTVRAPGSVERLSVSVVLDESVTAAQEASITSTVAAAVGLDQSRGDQLSVTRLPFSASNADLFAPETSSAFDLAFVMSLFRGFMLVLAVILAFVLVMLLLRAMSKRQMGMTMPSGGGSQLMLSEPMFAGALDSPRSVHIGDLVPQVDAHQVRVFRLAEENPRAVADVVQTWMRED